MTIARIVAERAGEVVCCSGTMLVKEAATILAERRIGALPVLEGGAVVGIFSERDVIYGLKAHGASLFALEVREVMTAPALTVDPQTAVLSAMSLMTRRRVRHLPVVEDGRMVGFVSIGDLVKYRMDRIESEAEALRSYIQTA